MPQLEFHVTALIDKEVQARTRFKRFGFAPVTLLLVIGAILLAASGHKLLPTWRPLTRTGDLPARRTVISGKEVIAQRVLVLVDNNGSMSSSQDRLRSQIQVLSAAGIDVRAPVGVVGFAISNLDSYTLLRTFTERVQEDPAIDTVYFISDFAEGDELQNTSDAIVAFSNVLNRTHVRLYFATVNKQPSPLYYELARQSGGDVIGVD